MRINRFWGVNRHIFSPIQDLKVRGDPRVADVIDTKQQTWRRLFQKTLCECFSWHVPLVKSRRKCILPRTARHKKILVCYSPIEHNELNMEFSEFEKQATARTICFGARKHGGFKEKQCVIQCVKKMSNRLDFTGDFIKSRPPEIISTQCDMTANELLTIWFGLFSI